MTPIFKRVLAQDVINAYDIYIRKGKPQTCSEIESVMAMIMIGRVNSEITNKKLVKMTRSQFDAYKEIFEI